MKTLRLSEVNSLSEARTVLLGLRKPLGDGLRIEVPVAGGPDPLAWLASQPAGERSYWSERGGNLEVAGIGAALDVAGRLHTALAQRQPMAPGWRWIGGEAFDPGQDRSEEWAGFGNGRFRIPAVSWERCAQQLLLCIHLLPEDRGDESRAWARAHAELAALALDLPAPSSQATAESEPRHTPDADEWTSLFDQARDQLPGGRLNKVVCARRTELDFTEAVDPFALLLSLSASQPGTFRFGIEHAPGHAFIGCTPELLFRREGEEITTEALAGTRRRGESQGQDDHLAADLESDDKDRREHQWVVRGLVSALRGYADLDDIPVPTVLRLPHVQHLRTPIGGTLRKGSDSDLLAALHPSPAVCGEPVAPARQFIRSQESFRRGWYAGPVGVASSSGACFAVAIRSALVVGRRLHVYAGAGWVDGSEADREWHEVEAKSRTVLEMVS